MGQFFVLLEKNKLYLAEGNFKKDFMGWIDGRPYT